MAIESPRQMLAEVEEKARRARLQDRSLWSLVQSIHSAPVVRDFVTIESVPLAPWVIPGPEGEATVHVLLSVPGPGGSLLPPWGYVAWSWPSRRMLTMSDVRRHTRGAAGLTPEHLGRRELADRMEAALAEGKEPPPPPAPIPELLRAVLGQAAPPLPAPAPEPARSVPPAPAGRGDGAVPRPLAPTPDLTPHLEAARRLLKEVGSPSLDREWRRIEGRLSSPRFTVVVLGERARGKSTLINRLLGEDLLPVGLREQMPAVVEISHDGEPSLRWASPDGEWRRGTLSTEELQSLQADPKAAGTVLRAGVPNEWLRSTGVRLVELPAMEDPESPAFARSLDALAAADAVVVVVSASMALSLTEKAFIEQNVLARRVPRLAVALTHLDSVREKERAEVVEFVRSKISAWGSGILLCASQTLPGGEAQAALLPGPDALLAAVGEWAGSADHQELTRRQVSANLRELLSLLRSNVEARRASAALTRDERRQRLEASQGRLESQRLDWEDLRLALQRRHLELLDWLGGEVRKRRQQIVGNLRWDLSHAANPKQWWERDLPFRLDRELNAMGRDLDPAIERRVLTDARWLIGEMEKRFETRLDFGGGKRILEFGQVEIGGDSQDLRDMTQLRLLVRGGSLALASAGYFLLSFGMLLSGTAVLFGEIFLMRVASQHREALSRALPEVIDQVVERALDAAGHRLRDLYTSLAEGLQERQEAWARVQSQALEEPGSEDGDLAVLDRQLTELDRSIAALVG